MKWSKRIVILFLIVCIFCLSSCDKSPFLCPSDDYVILALRNVEHVTEIEAVTEVTDPMNNLNKDGWYIGMVYFALDLVDKSKLTSLFLLDNGTNAGGAIEIYRTEKEAKARNDYLSLFDGQGFLDPGSHIVRGTCVIRTSKYLTYTQQDTVTSDILKSFEGNISFDDPKNYSGTYILSNDLSASVIIDTNDNTIRFYGSNSYFRLSPENKLEKNDPNNKYSYLWTDHYSYNLFGSGRYAELILLGDEGVTTPYTIYIIDETRILINGLSFFKEFK